MLKDHLQKLYHFVNVVEAGSMSKGSEKSFITQPQMTKIIKSLESELQTKLLVRNYRGVQTTAEGQILYAKTKELIDLTNQIELSIKNHLHLPNGEIRIGVYDSIARYFFPDFLRTFRSSFPGIKIHLYTGRSLDLLDKLKKESVDLCLVVANSDEAAFMFEDIYEDSFSFYQSPTIKSESQKVLIFLEVNHSGWSLDEDLKSRFDQFIFCENLETIRSLAENGVGVAFLPTRVAREATVKGHLKEYSLERSSTLPLLPHKISLARMAYNKRSLDYFVGEKIKDYLRLWLNS